jgi:putative oxidoreductase
MNSTDAALLIIRLALGGILLMHAWNHWFGGGRVAGTARWFESLGLRPGLVQAWASIATEIIAGGGLILGLLTPFACAAAIGPMVVAGLTAHRKNGFFVFKDGWEYVLLIGVTSAALALAGPGRGSLDHWLGLVIEGPVALVIALVGGIGGAAGLLALTWRPVRSPS